MAEVVSGRCKVYTARVPRRERDSLKCCERLHDAREFERVYGGRQAVHLPNLVVFYRANGLEFARLGVSVGRKHGNAVRRNRIKRCFRAAFRISKHLLQPGHDYVLVPRQGVAEYTTSGVCAALERAAKKLATAGDK